MVNHHLVCPKCKKQTFFGQGYGLMRLRGFEPKDLFIFIKEHFEHGIEVWDENMLDEEDWYTGED